VIVHENEIHILALVGKEKCITQFKPKTEKPIAVEVEAQNIF